MTSPLIKTKSPTAHHSTYFSSSHNLFSDSMVHFSALTLARLATAAASLAGAATIDSKPVPSDYITGASILECESSRNLALLVKAVQDQGGTIRRQFNSSVFYGLSVQLPNTTMAEHGMELMEQMPGVVRVWPVEVTRQPVEIQTEHPAAYQRRGNSAPWNHVMTQVDKLHAEGFTGSGIRVAVIDTGIDYTHPALGGCFGKGCRVALGENFSQDGDKNDPMDCQGHGTRVASILAEMMPISVADCDGEMKVDDVIAAWIKAHEDGAQIVVSSTLLSQGTSWAMHPAAAVVSRIVDSGVPCIVGVGNDRQAGLFSVASPSSGKGVTTVSGFSWAPDSVDGDIIKDTPMARFSSYGPNWDLDIKPTVGASAVNVTVASLHGGYKEVSGTSYSGPFVGGIMALMAEVRGSFDPVLLNSLLTSTAVPQGAPQGAPASVAEQGGGLVRAWDAAHATTLVKPASLAFNDTLHRAQFLTLHITNTAKEDVTYRLDALTADTLYTFVSSRPSVGQSPPVHESAVIEISQRDLVLGPGRSASVNISVTDPIGLDPGRLPVWSGWIAINSSNSGLLTIPYLGLSGSLKDQPIIVSGGVSLLEHYNPWYEAEDKDLQDGGLIRYRITDDNSWGLVAQVRIRPSLGTRLVRAEVVPVSPRKWLADRLQDRNLTAFTLEMFSHTEGIYETWNGRLASGDYIPTGRYKLAVRALRLFGDPNIESDWDLLETVTFQVPTGGGEKVCEMYRSRQAKISQNALFDSHQECLLVHGGVLKDIPWFDEPQNGSLCTKDSLTDESCGTLKFCNAHNNNLSQGLKSPFLSSSDCFSSHKWPLWAFPPSSSES
ncbi:subtilase-like protein [Beauveria bassiana ARSEF 2860]|uniref:Subtilase-like protein n=1 Tax=Beauveria bassiana (strain ARSEF 2860) TaxID=655819 RepID=J4VRK2_BEAB2|nr:subtilase-like protein [Beauveria bassiana ARSEF 2860]EJP61235.1 subtilase-like protein [Beauveria bassiana ARSEF 2860]